MTRKKERNKGIKINNSEDIIWLAERLKDILTLIDLRTDRKLVVYLHIRKLLN